MSTPSILEELNESTGMISPSIKQTLSKNYFIYSGWNLLNNAKGLTQFYDRDQTIENADIGMDGFKNFIQNPSDLEKILENIQNRLVK